MYYIAECSLGPEGGVTVLCTVESSRTGVAGHRRCTSRKGGHPLLWDTSRDRSFCKVLLNMQVQCVCLQLIS